MKPTRDSVALVIYNEERSRILIVQRPKTDEVLPGRWGLPAMFLRPGESFTEAVLRAGHQKLGLKVKVGKLVGEKSLERENFINHMKEFETEIVSGNPKVPQPFTEMTQYGEWQWGTAQDLIETARAGGLCDQIFLESKNIRW